MSEEKPPNLKTREIRLKIQFDLNNEDDPIMWNWLELIACQKMEVEYWDNKDWIPVCEIDDYCYQD
jgi:hypothetical protein